MTFRAERLLRCRRAVPIDRAYARLPMIFASLGYFSLSRSAGRERSEMPG